MFSQGFSPPMPPMAPATITGMGVLAQLRRNALSSFPERCLSEPVVRLGLPMPGRALFLVTGGAAMAEMLQTRAGDYGRMPTAQRVLGPVVGRGLLTSEGEQWRHQRKAMAPAFSPRALPMMASHVMRATEPACDRLARAMGGDVDLYDAMQVLSLEIASTTMFSIESDGFRDELRAMITTYMATIGKPMPQDFLLPAWLPTPLALRRGLFRRRWQRLMRGVVDQRFAAQRSGEEPRDLFDLLAAVHGQNQADLLVDEVATMIVAGHETTALTLFWGLYLLAHAPDWQAAIRAEVRAQGLSGETAAAELTRLPQTRAVVNETLRLYSPAYMTARMARADTQIAGQDVPRGSMILAPFWLLHRDPAFWRDPARFDPARFLADPAPDRRHFLPFGLGPNTCIGAQLAMTEAVLVLARIVDQFAITLGDGARPVLPVATLSTRPDHAPAFRLSPAP